MVLVQLTRRHGIKIPVGVEYSVEECSLAVGKIVEYSCIKSAARMNSAVVIFLETVEKVDLIIERGVVIREEYFQVFPLVNPVRRVVLFNVPPFISDEIIERELQRHGQIVSAIKKIPVGWKSPLLKHVVSFRRQLHMNLKNDMEELNIVLKFSIEGFDYVIFATTETMKCFRCNKQGHLARSCPEQVASLQSDVQDRAQTSSANDKRADVLSNGSELENRAHQSNEESTVGNPRENEEMESVEGRKRDVKDSDIIEAETSQREANEHSEIDLDEEGLIMNEEINMFKVPVVKRKADKSEKGSKSKALRKSQEVVKDKEGTDEASDDSSADDSSADDSSVFSYGEAEVVESMEHEGRIESGYSLERVQNFLSSTKGKRNVVASDLFS